MLTTKRINLSISILSRVLRFCIIFYTASILAQCIWWVVSPAKDNIFIEWADLDKQDKATGYINNRYPFGVVVVVKPKEEAKPSIVDQLRLTGVYLSSNKDSFAFLEYRGKPTLTRLGAVIGDSDATVKAINPDSITVNADGQDFTIKVSVGQASVSNNVATSNTAGSSIFGAASQNNSSNSQSNNGSSEDFKQRRKKLIEEYTKKERGGDSSESQSSNR